MALLLCAAGVLPLIKSRAKTVVKGQEKMDALRKVLSQYKEAYVTVGIHSDAGKYTDGTNPPEVYEVALWNEFGTADVPERSWFRSTLNENESKINQWREEMIDNILFKNWTIQKALDAIGIRLVILFQNKIKSNVPPEYGTGKHGNSSEVIAQRQAAKAKETGGNINTLINTGLMLRSVTSRTVLR